MLVYTGQTPRGGGLEAPRRIDRCRASVSYRLTRLLRRSATILSESRSVVTAAVIVVVCLLCIV